MAGSLPATWSSLSLGDMEHTASRESHMKKLVTPLLIGLSVTTFLVGCQTPNGDKTKKSTMNDTDTILGMERTDA